LLFSSPWLRNFLFDYSFLAAAAPSRPPHVSQSPFSHAPAAQNVPQPNMLSAEITPSAETRMFGRINHFQAENSDYNDASGDQINVHQSTGRTHRVPGPSILASHPHNQSTGLTHPVPGPSIVTSQSHNPDFAPRPSRRPANDGIYNINPLGDSNLTETAIGITNFVLKTLQKTAEFSSVVFLSQAAGVSLAILEGVQVCSQTSFLAVFPWSNKFTRRVPKKTRRVFNVSRLMRAI
jgi:hypothetical protein